MSSKQDRTLLLPIAHFFEKNRYSAQMTVFGGQSLPRIDIQSIFAVNNTSFFIDIDIAKTSIYRVSILIGIYAAYGVSPMHLHG